MQWPMPVGLQEEEQNLLQDLWLRVLQSSLQALVGTSVLERFRLHLDVVSQCLLHLGLRQEVLEQCCTAWCKAELKIHVLLSRSMALLR